MTERLSEERVREAEPAARKTAGRLAHQGLSRAAGEVDVLADTLAALAREVIELREAVRPFTHPDLCSTLSGNRMGDDSPVFGRNNATLTLGDFRRARRAAPPALGGDNGD